MAISVEQTCHVETFGVCQGNCILSRQREIKNIFGDPYAFRYLRGNVNFVLHQVRLGRDLSFEVFEADHSFDIVDKGTEWKD